jgi:hypothetical protein
VVTGVNDHEILARVLGDLPQRRRDLQELRRTIHAENATRQAAYAKRYATFQHADAAWQENPTVGPRPKPPDPPELLPDRTSHAEEHLEAQRGEVLRANADQIEREARAREAELVGEAREVAERLRPAVEELNLLLRGLRQTRQAVQNQTPGVTLVDGPAQRTPVHVDVIDLLIAATRGVALLAPVAATVEPTSRALVEHAPRLVPEPVGNGGVKLTYGTTRGAVGVQDPPRTREEMDARLAAMIEPRRPR